MTTNPVVTVTDELLGELESAAKARFNLKSGQCEGGLSLKGDVCSKCGNGPQDRCGMPLPEPYNAPATILALLEHIRTMQQELKAAHISVDNCELFRRQAGRYQFWSRTACYEPVKMAKIIAHCCTPDDLDAAIDAAMTASHSR